MEKTTRYKIKIPAGVRDGTRLPMRQERRPGAACAGGRRGDLYCRHAMSKEQIFSSAKAQTRSFLAQRTDQLRQGRTGAKSAVPTLEGRGVGPCLKVRPVRLGPRFSLFAGKGCPK